MSKPSDDIIACQRCGKEQNFSTWDSINVTLDRELKEKLITGEMTLFRCTKCGWTSQVNYPLLYHDMEKRLMVWLWPQPGEPTQKDSPFEKMMGSYKLRIVGTRNELIEKIFIFDHGFDDRVMEMLKLHVHTQSASGEHPLTGLMLFADRGPSDEGRDSLQFVHMLDNDTESFLLATEFYLKMENMMAGKLQKPIPGKWLRIDQNYARSMP